MASFSTQNCRIEPLSTFYNFSSLVEVLRLDLIHPLVSGNKWFKLKGYLKEAEEDNKNSLLTFGGAFSNHIVATAAAANMKGFKSIGIIRGEKPSSISQTLQDAAGFGMKLFFVSREFYKQKMLPQEVLDTINVDELYIIPEGGYGKKGAEGAEDILTLSATSSYTHIITAVGTGTTLAGLVFAALPHQKIIGISALKNNFSLQPQIEALLSFAKQQQFSLLHEYHFGGYAKYNKELIQFMNNLYAATNVCTDFVYTGKTFYAVFDLMKQGYFSSTDKILIIHTGGLQGNCSLSKGTLIFGS
jgi:1-aminocyclopropane-1-carboxylate deaminase